MHLHVAMSFTEQSCIDKKQTKGQWEHRHKQINMIQ